MLFHWAALSSGSCSLGASLLWDHMADCQRSLWVDRAIPRCQVSVWLAVSFQRVWFSMLLAGREIILTVWFSMLVSCWDCTPIDFSSVCLCVAQWVPFPLSLFSMPVFGSVSAISTEFIEYACVWLSECHFHWVYLVCLCVAQWMPFPLSLLSMPVCGSVSAISTEFIEYACVWLSECHFHWVYWVCLCVTQWVPFPSSSVQHANVWLSEGGCRNLRSIKQTIIPPSCLPAQHDCCRECSRNKSENQSSVRP